MKNNKAGIFLLIAFFSLLFSLLIFSCPNPFDIQIDTQTSPEELPQGFGSFSLRVESARTILPTPAPNLDDFAAYTLAFTATSGGASQTIDRANANLTSAVTLAVGTYSLTVSAYLDPGKTRLAAEGTLTGIVIGSGAQVSGSVTLKPLAIGTAGANGTFSWNINISASGVTSAKMEITKDGTAVSGSPVTLNTSGASTGSLTLASGKYNVRITLTKEGEEAVWDELLYVYAELTSNFTFEFDDNFFYTTRYTVTFDYDNDDTNGKQTVIHGGKITDPASAATWPLRAGLYPDPLPAHLTIEGWYRDGSITKWNFTNDAVTGNLTLYAKWSPIIDLSTQTTGTNDVERAIAYVTANAAAGEYTLLVGENVSISSQTLTLNSGANLTITSLNSLSPRTITRGVAGDSEEGLFIVSSEAKLTFENITLDGAEDTIPGNEASLVKVKSGGTFTMETGAVLQNNYAEFGGGVYVIGGTFTMDGGEISKNSASSGGGVWVDGGTFTMSGSASILNNTASNCGGGVYVLDSSTFTMDGGIISGNEADEGGGVSAEGGTFTMSGSASVSGNKAKVHGNYGGIGGGVVVSNSGKFTMNGGEVSGNTANEGGGVYITGTFDMYDGTISGNIITLNGGGVYVTNSGIFNMHNGTISGHTANHGGGVQAHDYGNFNMYGGTISGNKANVGGGGVRIEDNSVFTMTGGKISDNEASNTGGGVFVSAGTGSFIISGGEITGNTASNGGGVFISLGSFPVGGTAKIKENKNPSNSNNNVYLSSGKYITLDDGASAPANGMEIWVQTNDANGVIVQSGASAAIAGYFHADDASKAVVFAENSGNGQLVLVTPNGSPNSPWLVKNETDLRRVGTETGVDAWTLSANYKQTADITLTTAGQSNWREIGSSTAQFTGNYDGGGHTITRLTVNSSTSSPYNGMFAYIGSVGKVENLGLVNVDIKISNSGNHGYVGGIAGSNEGTIRNCFVSGSVSGMGNTQSGIFGGITGSNKGTIENCFFNGSVDSGVDQAGGIAGENYGTIQNCYAADNVRASTERAGGIVGDNYATGTVQNCVALNVRVTLTNVDTDTRIGRVSGTNTGTQQNNYAWSGMGLTNGSSSVTASPSTDGSGRDGADLTAAQAKTETWWTTATNWNTTNPAAAWDFTNVWQWNGTSGMPSLRGFSTVQAWPVYLAD